MILSFENVNFKYVTTPILDDVSFVLNEREKWGVVGINGSGKSTLLKIMAGREKADSGNVSVAKGFDISYCPQNDDFINGHTIMETIRERVKEKNVEDYQIKNILTRFNLNDYDQKIELLSGGQRKRLSLAIALITPADLYLLDEPTNHLDQDMILWLEDFLINMNKALVMVTHDRYFLSRITSNMMEISHGKVYCYQGNYADYLQQRQMRYEQMMSMERKRQNFLRREIEWIRAGAQARSTKQKSRIQRYEAVASQQAPVEQDKLTLQSAVSRLGGKTIEIKNISKSYDGIELFHDFSDVILKTDRIGIIGNNGCGKTTLLKTIMHQIIPDEGYVEIGDTVKIGYFAQGNEHMDPQMRLIDYIKQYGEVVQTADNETITASAMLERFLFTKDEQYNLIGKCSGGERRRLYLCGVLMGAPNILIMDEPTNDLDTDTLTILEDYIEDFKGAVIAVSHDRYFLDKICTRLWAFEYGNITNYICDYSTYIEENLSKQKVNSQVAEKKEKREKVFVSDKVVMSSKEKRELEKLTEEIVVLEEEISKLENQLSSLTDYKEISEVSSVLNGKQNDYEVKSERWMELSEKKELADKAR